MNSYVVSAHSHYTTYGQGAAHEADGDSIIAHLRAENAEMRDQLAARDAMITRLQGEQTRTEARGLMSLALWSSAAAAHAKHRQETLAERAWFKREGVPPAYKVTVAQVFWRLGITFGNPNPDRQYDFTTIIHSQLAKEIGVSTKVVGDYLAAMVTPTEECPVPILREKVTKKWRQPQAGDAPPSGTGKPKQVPYVLKGYAPADPVAFHKVVGDPTSIPVPTTFKRQARNTAHVAEKRAEEKAVVAEAARIIAARCPHCGSLHVDLLCRNCDAITPVSELPEVPDLVTAHAGAESAPPSTGEPVASYGQDALSAPLLVTKKTTRREAVSTSTAMSAPPSTDADSTQHAGADSAPPSTESIEQGGEDVEYPEVVRDLVAPEYAAALSGAVGVLVRMVEGVRMHVAMQRRSDPHAPKYLARAEPLTPRLIAEHLTGNTPRGTRLLTQDDPEDGRRCRAVAYDNDDAFGVLVVAAQKLAARGVTALLVRNPAKRNSGHMWVFFDGEVDPARAFAVLEHWAPSLSGVRERFPNPTIKGGQPLRLPGGAYLPVGGKPVPVQIALTGTDGTVMWEDALSPMAWVLIADAVTPAVTVRDAWLPTDQRPAPPVPPKAAPTPTHRAQPAASTIDDAVARFNHDHPVQSLVDGNPSGFFRSPWHADATPSCHRRVEGGREYWVDFSSEQRGGDALDLYCALQGRWTLDQDREAQKKTRIAVLQELGYVQPRTRKEGYHPELRGDALLVRLHIADADKFKRALSSFTRRFEHAAFDREAKVWVLQAADLSAANAWAREFAAAEGAAR